MNIEELKLILETVQAAGEGAYVIALLWLGRDVFVHLVSMATIIGVVWMTMRLIGRVSKTISFASEICELFNKDICNFSDQKEVYKKVLSLKMRGDE